MPENLSEGVRAFCSSVVRSKETCRLGVSRAWRAFLDGSCDLPCRVGYEGCCAVRGKCTSGEETGRGSSHQPPWVSMPCAKRRRKGKRGVRAKQARRRYGGGKGVIEESAPAGGLCPQPARLAMKWIRAIAGTSSLSDRRRGNGCARIGGDTDNTPAQTGYALPLVRQGMSRRRYPEGSAGGHSTIVGEVGTVGMRLVRRRVKAAGRAITLSSAMRGERGSRERAAGGETGDGQESEGEGYCTQGGVSSDSEEDVDLELADSLGLQNVLRKEGRELRSGGTARAVIVGRAEVTTTSDASDSSGRECDPIGAVKALQTVGLQLHFGLRNIQTEVRNLKKS